VQSLFVYGTLKPGMRRWKTLQQMAELRGVDLDPRSASASGRLYYLPAGFPAMVIAHSPRDFVQGYVITLNGDPALIQTLNQIEGYIPFSNNLYEPVKIKVVLDIGIKLKNIWSYTMSEQILSYLCNNETFMKFPKRILSGNWNDSDFPGEKMKINETRSK